MATETEQLRVRSHVGRDILQNAALFKNEAAAIWEYVVNSLEYTESGIAPRVRVKIRPRKKEVEITDNAKGMSRLELAHFFTMHGENPLRRRGLAGRGKFGTGKSAAFGIARELLVDTVKNGKRNVVRLTRSAIESSQGEEIPIEVLKQDDATDVPNGTRIVIREVFLEKINTPLIISFIEKHLSAFRYKSPVVVVNNHPCNVKEIGWSTKWEAYPNADERAVLGDVKLTVYAAERPLDADEVGVFVFTAPGALVAQVTAGIEKKDMGSWLFGEIECSALEEFDSEMEPYSSARDLTLNLSHPVVKILIPFISSQLEVVRRKLVASVEEERRSEEMKRLRKSADEMADLINRDFRDLSAKLRDVRTPKLGGGEGASSPEGGSSGGEDATFFALDDEEGEAGSPVDDGLPVHVGSKPKGDGEPKREVEGKPDDEGDKQVSPRGGGQGQRSRSGFKIEWEHAGVEGNRCRYERERRRILINLDHPQVEKLRRAYSNDEISFLRHGLEFAAVEYGWAVALEMTFEDDAMPAGEALYEVRERIDAVARLMADFR